MEQRHTKEETKEMMDMNSWGILEDLNILGDLQGEKNDNRDTKKEKVVSVSEMLMMSNCAYYAALGCYSCQR